MQEIFYRKKQVNMYPRQTIQQITSFIFARDGIADKKRLSEQAQQAFGLAKARSVFYGNDFAIRFCSAASPHCSNTVLSLSALLRYDRMPFLVCLVTPIKNYLCLANTTFLTKISHSSQTFRADNIRGSFNYGDITQEFENMANRPENFEYLFAVHAKSSVEKNLQRLEEATKNIHPSGKKFTPTKEQTACILRAPERAAAFMLSAEYTALNADLDKRVRDVQEDLAAAAEINNVNLRGRVIESLITAAENDKQILQKCLRDGKTLPKIYTADALADYMRRVGSYDTATDIKSKVANLSSNPKGYNIDKLLSFLAQEQSVYMIYIVSVRGKEVRTRLCSPFSRTLLENTRIIKHWAGRNSRGVTQYEGQALENLLNDLNNKIDQEKALAFMTQCLQA